LKKPEFKINKSANKTPNHHFLHDFLSAKCCYLLVHFPCFFYEITYRQFYFNYHLNQLYNFFYKSEREKISYFFHRKFFLCDATLLSQLNQVFSEPRVEVPLVTAQNNNLDPYIFSYYFLKSCNSCYRSIKIISKREGEESFSHKKYIIHIF